MSVLGIRHQFSTFVQAANAARPSPVLLRLSQPSRAAAGDGFDVARRAPIDLGMPPPASRASDADFVKGLYRDLLGREPDLDGYHSYMRGLETGVSREELRQSFLGSPEFREKAADFVKGLYRDLLGREPDVGGFNSHMRGLESGVSREELRQIFLNSPEYREKKAAEASPPPAPVVPKKPEVPGPDPIQTLPSPISGAPDFDAAYPQIKRMNVVASAEASPGEQQVFWTQALVRGRANNGWTVPQDEVKALVQKSGGDIDNYSKEMIRAVAAKLRRPLTREEACVVIYKVQHQYRAEVDALMQEYGR